MKDTFVKKKFLLKGKNKDFSNITMNNVRLYDDILMNINLMIRAWIIDLPAKIKNNNFFALRK